jgi:hypothetical protein
MLRAKNGLPEHCTWNVDRGGKRRRVRFRRRGVTAYLRGIPWSEPFMRAYAAALERATARMTPTEIGASKTKPGSVNALVVSYYKLMFPTLAASTQAMRRGILERFRKDFGDDLIVNFERKHITAITCMVRRAALDAVAQVWCGEPRGLMVGGCSGVAVGDAGFADQRNPAHHAASRRPIALASLP